MVIKKTCRLKGNGFHEYSDFVGKKRKEKKTFASWEVGHELNGKPIANHLILIACFIP